MIKAILPSEEEVLNRQSEPVTVFDGELRDLVSDMFDSMYKVCGLGLSANQIGSSKAVMVMNTKWYPDINRFDVNQGLVFVNPRIVKRSGAEITWEGCLSIPGLRWKIERAVSVEVEASDLSGRLFTKKLNWLSARCAQHETDHLNAILCKSLAVNDPVKYQELPNGGLNVEEQDDARRISRRWNERIEMGRSTSENIERILRAPQSA